MKKKKDVPIIVPSGTMMRYDQERIVVDPNGSYTGVGENLWDIPVQDADDL